MKAWIKEHVVYDLLAGDGLPYRDFIGTLLSRGATIEMVQHTINRYTNLNYMTASNGRFVLCDVDAETRRHAEVIMECLREKKLIPKSHELGTRDCIERGLRKVKQERYLKERR